MKNSGFRRQETLDDPARAGVITRRIPYWGGCCAEYGAAAFAARDFVLHICWPVNRDEVKPFHRQASVLRAHGWLGFERRVSRFP